MTYEEFFEIYNILMNFNEEEYQEIKHEAMALKYKTEGAKKFWEKLFDLIDKKRQEHAKGGEL